MKKSLLALAAIGAFAGTAQAQSSVTVYGTLDASVGRADSGATATNGVVNAVVGGYQVTDRLGFRGVEDLGSGRTAFFNLEINIAPFSANTGKGGAGNGQTQMQDNPGSIFNNRRPSFIGLTDKTLGAVQVGSMFSQGFLFTGYGAADGFNALGTNKSEATVVASTSATTAASTIGSSDSSFKQNSNTIQYTSPTFAGVNAVISHTLAAAGTTAGMTLGSGRVNGATLNYTLGKFTAKAMLEEKTVIAGGPFTKHKSVGLGVGYDFGVINVRATTQKGTLDSTTAAGVRADSGVVTVSKFTFVAPVTPVISISGGYIMLGENAAGSMYSTAGVTGKASMYNIGAEYKMSKRTSLYASYAALSNDSVGSKFSLTTTVGTADKNPSDLRVGMRHTF